MAESVLALAAVPRSNQELREHLTSLDPDDVADQTDRALWRVRRHVPFINAPADTPWAFERRPAYVAASTWLSKHTIADEDTALDHLVRR